MLAIIAFLLVAQIPNAVLSGTVLDPAEGVVTEASITIENVRTGVRASATTTSSGLFTFPSVQPGTYRISVEKAGFQTQTSEVPLEIGDNKKIDFRLRVAGVFQAVEVVAGPSLSISGISTSVGGVISGVRVQDLPLPERNALGLVLTQSGLVGNNFAGSRIGALNVTRDGINVMDQRINSGVNSVIFNSVDSIDEVRVITSPADAELGRGSGQVLISSRSGTNEFHGSVFEFHQNAALNANSWSNNWRGIPRDPFIGNQFGARMGGPIRRNNSFFHILYEGDRTRLRDQVTATTYTETARAGLFRFFPGAQNANANAQNPAVDLAGNPVKPASATGDLQTISVFGRDPFRPGRDRTGVMQRTIDLLPLPNDFRAGDGLNTAGYTWVRPVPGNQNQYNVKIDHIFTENHRLSVSGTGETSDQQNGFMPQPYPEAPGGWATTRNMFYSAALTSIVSPSFMNEFRGGAQRGRVRFFAPWESDQGRKLLPQSGMSSYVPIAMLATDFISTGEDPQGRISPMYVIGDTVSWTKGRHAFRGGAEARFVSTNGFNAFDVMPRAYLGAGGEPIAGLDSFVIPSIGQNEGTAQALLSDLSGSLDGVIQAFNATGGSRPTFIPGETKQRTWREREFAFFFKDDFRLRPDLNLNLGVRYEFYGVPFEANGRAAALKGGSAALNGSALTEIILVGRNSPNPRSKLYQDDWNNWAPAVGLSWALPFWGANKTVLRAGYGIGYERSALRLTDIIAGDQPGLRTTAVFAPDEFLDLSLLRLPLRPVAEPLETIPVTDRTQTVRSFDDHLRTPYVQNWNLSLERQVTPALLVTARYVGSKGTRLLRSTDSNEVKIVDNGILEAFKITQAGGNAPLFDSLLNGLNLGLGPVNGNTVTGSASLRAFQNTRSFLANNEAGSFARYLNSTANFTGVPGGLLRRARLPENFIVANPQFAGAVLTGNFANSTYHSLQLEAMRPFANGWTLQSNYTFSKALGEEDGFGQDLQSDYRDGRRRGLDKRLLAFNRTHVLRNSGIWQLPFGPNRRFLNRASGLAAHLVGGWQIGAIVNLFSGSPIGFGSGINSFNQFGRTTPNAVGILPVGQVRHEANGARFFPGLKQVTDSAQNLTSLQGLSGRSTLKAIADETGNLILVNPSPGEVGSLALYTAEGPGVFRFDVNVIKRISLKQDISLEIRADFVNVLNKPQFGNPVMDINSTSFGKITRADGSRFGMVGGRITF